MGVGLYLHVPFCVSKCRYCSFYSEPVASFDTGRVVSAMCVEMGRYGRGVEVDTVYVGGGSPSCLPRAEFFALVDEIASQFGEVEEFTVEVNPGQVDLEFLRGLNVRGVNRLSIGGQSFVDEELSLLGRIHKASDIVRAYEVAREGGFCNISIDLIFAIPGATVESFGYSLERVIALGCEHVSAYSLSIEPGTVFGRACGSGEMVKTEEQTDRAMYERAIEELEAAGLGQYEISNFARVGFECAHNLKYWANDTYIGIGAGAWSYYDGWRYSNAADIGKYCEMLESGESARVGGHLSEGVEAACETAVLNLRRRKGICRREFMERCGCDVMELFGETVERYAAAGLLETSDEDGGRLYLSQEALPIADRVLCDFSSV